MPVRRAPRATSLLAAALLPALAVLFLAAAGHVYRIFDSHHHDTFVDCKLACQTLHGMELASFVVILLRLLASGRAVPTSQRIARPAPLRHAASRAPPPACVPIPS